MKPHYLVLALGAILLWASMATLSVGLVHLPPLLMVGIALSLGGLPGLIRVRDWRVPLRTFAVGVVGIFGYHFLLFTGFHHAPIVEANLLNYLWPLLIVLLTPLVLPGTRLAPRHLLGAGAGLLGAALIATGGSLHPDLASLPGYLLATAAALTWAFYSLLTKRVPAFSSGAVGAFCLTSGLLSLGVYLLQAGPSGFLLIRASDWPLLLVIGLGPLGTAFYLWDAALKRGDSRVIGSLSYITPLMSTLLLILVGGRPFSLLSAAAMVLIVAGAVVGSLGAFRRSEGGAGRDGRRAPGSGGRAIERRGIKAVLFDFDGTLTRPEAIDFGALRRLLGCPTGVPILEYIEGLQSPEARAEAMGRLERFELDAARASIPNDGAEALLLLLKQKGYSQRHHHPQLPGLGYGGPEELQAPFYRRLFRGRNPGEPLSAQAAPRRSHRGSAGTGRRAVTDAGSRGLRVRYSGRQGRGRHLGAACAPGSGARASVRWAAGVCRSGPHDRPAGGVEANPGAVTRALRHKPIVGH